MADSLILISRNFYDYAKAKTAFAMSLAGFGLMLLGLCSEAGGVANQNAIIEGVFCVLNSV